MRILAQKIFNLPVETQKGRYLGRVAGFTIDTNTQSIISYEIKSSFLVGFLKERLIINSSQVISIEKDKMIVEENIEWEKERVLEEVKAV